MLTRLARNTTSLAVKLPTLVQETPAVNVQVPFLPHFWDSAQSKPKVPLQLDPPKLLVVGGSATHYDGGPTHNLEKPQEDSSPVHSWADLKESLGLSSVSNAEKSAIQAEKDLSRPLTADERSGLYILLGIVGGSWLVGALVNRPTAVAEETHPRSTLV